MVSEWITDPVWVGKCADILCSTPGDNRRYGPVKGCDRAYEEDLNGTPAWICHRITTGLRPELYARITRTKSVPFNAVEARLKFDVYSRRQWWTDPDCNSSQEVRDPPPFTSIPYSYPGNIIPEGHVEPAGTWYCVDYYCDREVGPYDVGGDKFCGQYQCRAEQGYAWPHLKAMHGNDGSGGNNSAEIELTLEPFDRSEDKSKIATSWIVASASPKEGKAGRGYTAGENGDVFLVDFDPAWMPPSRPLYGQYINPFPLNDYCATLDWRDDLNNTLLNGEFPIQRLRVTEVDDKGGIVSLEVVPWRKDPEYRNLECKERITDREQKTKYYAAYTRVLCHPQCVDIPGEGYSIGDKIEWFCTDPACVTASGRNAVAYVTDVDDKGGVLDWHIKGSDICMYGYGGHMCGFDPEYEFPNLGRLDCAADGYPQTEVNGQDERGAYKFDGKRLCELSWRGYGNPARAAATVEELGGFVLWQANRSTYTTCQITIAGSPCRTTLNVGLSPYKYESFGFLADIDDETQASSWQNQLLLWFRPYPKCYGGGAVIEATYGVEQSPAKIGGPLLSASVIEPGGGWAFRDKYHTPPVLPTAVPNIGSGSGAKILVFAFASVTNFPAMGYSATESHKASSSRFAYFPVEDAIIDADHKGKGYEVGQRFEVKPVRGGPYVDPWSVGGGDDPDASPNGNWYSGRFSSELTESGHLSTSFLDGTLPSQGDKSRQSVCLLEISSVDSDGGITGLEVIHGGLMYKSVWAGGVKHPDVGTSVTSDTGSGGSFSVTVNTNHSSELFGKITSARIDSGGEQYADAKGGIMWELLDLGIGGEICQASTLMSNIKWDGWLYDPTDSSKSTHVLIGGSLPPVVKRSTSIVFDECYHALLNKTYPLYRAWGMNALEGDRSAAETVGTLVEMWPTTYALFRKKDAIPYEDGSYQNSDYTIIEWGFSMTLSATIPATCPDHTNGRTSI